MDERLADGCIDIVTWPDGGISYVRTDSHSHYVPEFDYLKDVYGLRIDHPFHHNPDDYRRAVNQHSDMIVGDFEPLFFWEPLQTTPLHEVPECDAHTEE